MKRHLLYFICPFEDNEEWILNIESIKKYLNVFTGKKIITIATGENIIDPEVVKSQFEDPDIDFKIVENDQDLGEVPHFISAMKEVEKFKDDVTFYAHAKGTWRVNNQWHPMNNQSIRRWRECMYRYCLGNILRIDRILSKNKACGCFKKTNFHISLPTRRIRENFDYDFFQFSGTFFWFKNSLFNDENWEEIDKNRSGVECYLGRHMNASEAFNLFPNFLDEDTANKFKPYFICEKEWDYLERCYIKTHYKQIPLY